ncbi:MAG: hypothetical protein WCT32_00180 [Patescibacteria group bacterium]|jgi:hypothetical protein
MAPNRHVVPVGHFEEVVSGLITGGTQASETAINIDQELSYFGINSSLFCG